MSFWRMSPEQARRYAAGEITRFELETSYEQRPPGVPADLKDAWRSRMLSVDQMMAADLSKLGWFPGDALGIWRCQSGEITCALWECSDGCGCCSNAELWEEPVVEGWKPGCGFCGRPALLVTLLE